MMCGMVPSNICDLSLAVCNSLVVVWDLLVPNVFANTSSSSSNVFFYHCSLLLILILVIVIFQLILCLHFVAFFG